MPRETRLAATLLALTAFQLAFATPSHAVNNPRDRRLIAVALTADQRLIAFRLALPSRARDVGFVTNLSGDSRLVGIDFRPATGELYGLGDAGGIYTLSLDDAEATFESQLNVSGMPLALTGAFFGVDFNPTVDRLRVVSDTGQDLRINVDTGAATVDPLLNVLAGMPPAPATATGVTGVAYTNNDADANTGTTLFDIDTDGSTDQLFIQAPPNAGTLNLTGNLGVDAVGDVGFDIYSRTKDGTTLDVAAYAVLTTDRSRLYEINPFTGKALPAGAFRPTDRIAGFAILLAQD
jgi:hypothetical protein